MQKSENPLAAVTLATGTVELAMKIPEANIPGDIYVANEEFCMWHNHFPGHERPSWLPEDLEHLPCFED